MTFWGFFGGSVIFLKTYNELEYGVGAENMDKLSKRAIVKGSSSYFGCFCRRNKFCYGLKGNPVQVRDDPVTVIVSEPHNVTGARKLREGAASVEHKSGDLLVFVC